LNSLLPK